MRNLILLAIIITGCAHGSGSERITYEDLSRSAAPNANIGDRYPPPEDLHIPTGQSIVLVRYRQQVERTEKDETYEPWFSPRIVNLATSKTIAPIPRKSKMGVRNIPPLGTFEDFQIWFLPPGEYSFLDVRGYQIRGLRAGAITEFTKRIDSRFAVLNSGEIVYLGDLMIDGVGLKCLIAMRNNYHESMELFRHQFINARGVETNGFARPTRD